MESTRDAEEIKKNIPVICNSSRSDGVKPHGIHLNPKFFKSSNERPLHGHYGPNQVPPGQPRFNHDIRMPFDSCPSANHFDPFLQHRYTPPGPLHPRFRPQFPPYQEPSLSTSFPIFNGPPSEHLNWREGPMMPNFSHNHLRHPAPPFPNNHLGPPVPSAPFPPNYMEYNANYPVYSSASHQQFHHAPLSNFQQSVMGPIPNSPYYDEGLLEFGKRARRRQSRSQSSSSRRHRSLSGSSDSYTHKSSHGRRSRSLSPSRSYTRNESSSSENSSEDETIWDSNNERNSDSDLDLSKPLDSLTCNVGNSTSLLKDALKCLGPSKVQTMIPIELSQLSRRQLFHMCKELLDDTENDELIEVLEGNISARKKDEQCSNNFPQSEKQQSKECDSDNNSSSLVKRKVNKKKKSKKKRKKRRKRKESDYEPESSEEESPEYLDVDSNNSESSTSGEKSKILSSTKLADNTNVPKHGSSGVCNTQQSLLELIQIEYKTKAINVMLKNLGVATEINSLVSNALNTNGANVVQNLQVAHDNVEEKKLSVDNCSTSSEQRQYTTTTTTPSDDDDHVETTIVIGKLTSPKELKSNDEPPENTFSRNELNEKDAANDLGNSESLSLVDETELLKRVADDVLDLEVGANEKIDFSDI